MDDFLISRYTYTLLIISKLLNFLETSEFWKLFVLPICIHNSNG